MPSSKIQRLMELADTVRAPTPQESSMQSQALKRAMKAMKKAGPMKPMKKATIKPMKAKGPSTTAPPSSDIPKAWEEMMDRFKPADFPDVPFKLLVKRAHSNICETERRQFHGSISCR